MDTVQSYIAAQEPEIREKLELLRRTILEAAPGAAEKISWGMPTFVSDGNLVHFASQKHHIGLYPGGGAVEAFQDRLGGYKTTKGGIQFPKADPIPLDLVREIVTFCREENIRDAEEKKKKKP